MYLIYHKFRSLKVWFYFPTTEINFYPVHSAYWHKFNHCHFKINLVISRTSQTIQDFPLSILPKKVCVYNSTKFHCFDIISDSGFFRGWDCCKNSMIINMTMFFYVGWIESEITYSEENLFTLSWNVCVCVWDTGISCGRVFKFYS